MPLLHQPPPTPDECQKPDGSCPKCIFFRRCREWLMNRHVNSMPMSEIEVEARQNSLGGLAFEERSYSPD